MLSANDGTSLSIYLHLIDNIFTVQFEDLLDVVQMILFSSEDIINPIRFLGEEVAQSKWRRLDLTYRFSFGFLS
jgi:hypothetical protein